jgi:signal transduction histidine kinase
MAQKDEFISVASHELKTPLTSLTAALQVLERSDQHETPLTRRMILQANKSLKRINSLVADLLNVKRITSGSLPLNQTVFPIGKLIEECCGYVREQGNYRIHLEGDTGAVIFADQQKIEQVLVNLVNNAIKYAPDAFDIYITVRKEAEFARIAVRDNGSGIATEHLPHLFERYYRSGQHNTSGLGLGLYIVDAIVKQHGGQVGAESEQGKGSTFWFTLPLAQN